MTSDPNTIAQILSVNGLTLQSPPDQIQDLLMKAGYKPEEIQQALAVLTGTPVASPATPVTPMTPPAAPVMPVVPTPATVAPFTPVASVTSIQSSTKSSWISVPVIITALIVLVVLGGGGAFAYYELVPPTPMTILERGLENSVTAKTFTFAATSTGSATAGNSSPLASLGQTSPLSENFTGTSAGSVDISSTTAPLFDVTTNGSVGIDIATSSGSLTGGLHVIFLDKKIYLNLINFHLSFTSSDPKLAGDEFFVALANGFVTGLENKWIEVDATTTPFIGNPTSAQQADYASLRSYVTGFSYIKSVQDLGVQNINGVDAYHLQVTVQNTPQLVSLVQKTLTDSEPSAQNTPEFQQQMADLSQTLQQPISSELWIGKSDFRIYKVAMGPFTVADSQTGATTTITDDEASIGNYGQPVNITAPAGAEPLSQVFKGMF